MSSLTPPLSVALWPEINLLARALRRKYPHLTASITVSITRLPCKSCQKEKQSFQVTLCEKTVSKAYKQQLAKAKQTGHKRTRGWGDLLIKNADPTMAQNQINKSQFMPHFNRQHCLLQPQEGILLTERAESR